MQYRRVDEDTIQCIVTGEDMSERGLTLGDLLSRSERAEGFLRELIEGAHEEIGYEIRGTSLSLQITPLDSEGMIITITNDTTAGLRSFLEHIRDVMEAIVGGSMDDLFEGLDDVDENSLTQSAKPSQPLIAPSDDQPEDIRIFEFDSIDGVLEFAKEGFVAGQVKSCLGYADNKYYLVVTKNRCSWKNFNKLSAKAYDYANVIADIKGKLVYLGEHGEEIIASGALNKLKKISDPQK